MGRLVALFVIGFLAFWNFSFDRLPFTPGARFSDAVTAHYSAALHLHRAESIDDLLWQQTTFAGAPFAANPLSKTAYSPQWFAFILDPVLHLNLMIAVHRTIAALGMMTWAMGCGLSLPAAFLAALAYLLSPRLMAHIGGGHLDVLYAMAWFPWLMEAVRRLGASRDLHRVLLIGLYAGLLVLSDVRVSVFALTLAVAYGLWLTRGTRLAQTVFSGTGAVVFAGLIAVPVIVPLLAWSPYLTRAALTPAEANAFAMQPAQLVGMIIPPPSGNLETIPYVGITVLILALFALARAPRRLAFWAGACLLAALWSLGESGGLWAVATTLFPPLLWFRVPARAWLVIVLIAPLLAGFGFDALLAMRRARPSLALLIAGAGLIIGGGYVYFGLGLSVLIGVSMAIGGIAALCAALYGVNGRMRRILTADMIHNLFTVCIIWELTFFSALWSQARPVDAWQTDSQRVLAERLIALDAGRVYSPDYALEQQTAALYDLRLFGGVDPFQIDGVARAIRAAGGVRFDGYSIVQPPLVGVQGDAIETANRDAVPNARLLGEWGVTHVVARAPVIADGLTYLDGVEGIMIYAVDPDWVVPLTGRIPDWTASPPIASDVVASLNQITLVSAGVGALALMGIILTLIFFGRRERLRSPARGMFGQKRGM